MAAWATRNLLELKFITQYVLSSKEAATNFRNDFLVDAKEFNEAITNHTKAIHRQLVTGLEQIVREEEGPHKEAFQEALKRETAREPDTRETEADADALKELMSEYGLKENARPERVSEMAVKLKERESFHHIFKICSKIMHRTTISIASANDAHGLDAIVPFFKESGLSDFAAIYNAVEAHFKTHGVRPPQV